MATFVGPLLVAAIVYLLGRSVGGRWGFLKIDPIYNSYHTAVLLKAIFMCSSSLLVTTSLPQNFRLIFLVSVSWNCLIVRDGID